MGLGAHSGTPTTRPCSKIRRRVDDGRITAAMGGGRAETDVTGNSNTSQRDRLRGPLGARQATHLPLVARPARARLDLRIAPDARGWPMVDKIKKLWIGRSSLGRREGQI